MPAVSPDWVLWSCLVRNEAKREGEIGPLKVLFSYKLNSTVPPGHLAVPVPVDRVPGPQGGAAQQPPLGQVHTEDALAILQKLSTQRSETPSW